MALEALVLLGPPGAGKGTQARFLSKSFGLPLLSAGDLLRHEAKKDTPVGARLRHYVDSGEMAPWSLMCEVLENHLKDLLSHPSGQAFHGVSQESSHKSGAAPQRIIFDGIPRYKSQVQDMESVMEKFNISVVQSVLLAVPDEDLLFRMLQRLQCSRCGMSMEALSRQASHKPEEEKTSSASWGLCSFCGAGELVARSDDKEEVIRHRLSLYHASIAPLVEYYQSMGVFTQLDGSRPAQEVQKELQGVLQKKGWVLGA